VPVIELAKVTPVMEGLPYRYKVALDENVLNLLKSNVPVTAVEYIQTWDTVAEIVVGNKTPVINGLLYNSHRITEENEVLLRSNAPTIPSALKSMLVIAQVPFPYNLTVFVVPSA